MTDPIVRVDARLVPAILMLQHYVEEQHWGSVTLRFQGGVPGLVETNETVKLDPTRVASGMTVALVAEKNSR